MSFDVFVRKFLQTLILILYKFITNLHFPSSPGGQMSEHAVDQLRQGRAGSFDGRATREIPTERNIRW